MIDDFDGSPVARTAFSQSKAATKVPAYSVLS